MRTYWVPNTAGDAAIKLALSPLVGWVLAETTGTRFIAVMLVILPLVGASVAVTHRQLSGKDGK